MSFESAILIAVGMVVLVVVVAWLIRRSGFSVEEITAKTGPLEVKMKHQSGADTPKTKTPADRTEVVQTASEGGVIHKSGIKAPAQSNSKIDQQSRREGSLIDDSPIEIK